MTIRPVLFAARWQLDATSQLRTWTYSYNVNLIGQDKLPTGKRHTELPPAVLAGPPRATNLLTWTFQYNPNLVGKDQLPTGRQWTELTPGAPPGPPRAIDLRTWTFRYNPNLVGKDVFPPGAQRTDLPLRGPEPVLSLRTWTSEGLKTAGVPPVAVQYTMLPPPLPAVRTWVWMYNPNLIGQDVFPAGAEWTALPPAVLGPPRAINLWTWTYQYNPNLVGRDQLPPGGQLTELPPRGAEPSSSFRTWTSTGILSFAQPPGAKWTELAPKAHLEPATRTWTQRYNPNLVGLDVFPPGGRWIDLPPLPQQPSDLHPTMVSAGIRSITTSFPNNQYDWPVPKGPEQPLRSWTSGLTQNLMNLRAPGASSTELPFDAYTDPATRTWVWAFNPNFAAVVEVVPFGLQWTALPQRPQQPLYGWTASYNRNLIGLDVLVTAARCTELPPRAHSEPATRTWTQRYNPNLVGQDVLPAGAISTELPPIAAQRAASLRTWTFQYNPNLIGQDAFPVGKRWTDLPTLPQQSGISRANWVSAGILTPPPLPNNQYDWPLPKAPLQPLYGWTATYNANLIGLDALPPGKRHTELPPRAYEIPNDLRTWVQAFNLPLRVPPGQRPFNQSDWPLTPQVVQPSRTWTAFYNPNLVGRDVLPPGARFTELSPRAYERANDLRTWIPALNPNLFVPPTPPAVTELHNLPIQTYVGRLRTF